MRESTFIEQNQKKWVEFEEELKKSKKDPEKLSSLFIQVTDDLSYSRTFYPNRMVRYYLNYLAQKVFLNLYKNKQQGKKIRTFWKEELPQLMYESRKELTLSLAVFLLSVTIGVLSSFYDPTFPSLILGDSYIAMTKANIAKGDPMAVYKASSEYDMMLGITLNNIKVAFMTFLFGILLGIGSIAFLLYNGIMVGAFQYFFISKGIFTQSILTIWLHGTLEISAIIIAGGAGITLGKGLVFPGTYSRLQAFQVSARRGLKIWVGIIPIIVCAAIIESFLTRYTDVPSILRVSVILLSLAFVVFYFIILPFRIAKKNGYESQLTEAKLAPDIDVPINIEEINGNGEILKDIFVFLRKRIKYLVPIFFFSALLYSIPVALLLKQFVPEYAYSRNYLFIQNLFDFSYYTYEPYSQEIPFGFLLFAGNVLNAFITLSVVYFFLIRELEPLKWVNYFRFLLKKGGGLLIVSILLQLLLPLDRKWIYLIFLLPLPVLSIIVYAFASGKESFFSGVYEYFSLSTTAFWKLMGLNLTLLVLCTLCFFISNSPLLLLYFEIASWNFPFIVKHQWLVTLFVSTFSSVFFMNLFLGVYYTGMGILYYSLREIKYAENLLKRISNIGQSKT